jgi:hypothetical protein
VTLSVASGGFVEDLLLNKWEPMDHCINVAPLMESVKESSHWSA